MPLESPDIHHLSAAQGWLELGNHLEADAELARITPALRSHPDVLELRWQIYAKAGKWEPCVDIATALVATVPGEPNGWIHRSHALHELKRTEQASDLLLPAVDLFPKNWLIRYNLACYACRLGNNEEAWDWLEDAFELGDGKAVKLMALDDQDLERFWAEIGDM